ncbi:hypothetical protein [Streptacidiphilus pinicola]|uniref:hypothetical protein n=1 Tax=Streptacidiphilus pinicola TaxID=2219663 RepID=UPI00105818AB|nr:hypothetical protein [Streptacidiphilus pinicola]
MPSLVIAIAALATLFALRRQLGQALRGRRNLKLIDSFRPEAFGLVPRAELDASRAAPPPSAELTARRQGIADAAWAGDFQPAAAYVAEAGNDWDERWSRLELLQYLAGEDETWLAKWRADQPDNADAATLHASLLLHNAWKVRGGGFANQVPPERMAKFKQMLPASMEAARAAAELAPENPGPWVVMITAARGLRYSHEQFQPLWAGLQARTPLHVDGHWQAMQYWCAKWHGSNEAMMQFAEAALAASPEGSALAGTYLHALHELEGRKAALPSGPRAVQLLDRVRVCLLALPADDERLPALRHLLAHFLLRAEQYDAALEQFQLLGRWCGAYPWTDAADPIAEFDRGRALAAQRSSRSPAE